MILKYFSVKLLFLSSFFLVFLVISCQQKSSSEEVAITDLPTVETEKKSPEKPLSDDFKSYWFAGKAEISSFKLEQVRYGELREGHAVLIFVTEDFLPEKQVKADYRNPDNISVLKLNAVKKFSTGIYPYSIMQSIFYPLGNNQHAIKVSASIQEWCGHTYMQLNNKNGFDVTIHSYFESEADQKFQLNKAILENEIWTQLRIDPKSLPTGHIELIPAFEYLRLKHIPLKPYKAEAHVTDNSYNLYYPELSRKLKILFNPKFPYDILSWEETAGEDSRILTTKATRLKSIKTPYWNKNSNANEVLRDTLQIN